MLLYDTVCWKAHICVPHLHTRALAVSEQEQHLRLLKQHHRLSAHDVTAQLTAIRLSSIQAQVLRRSTGTSNL
jgi:hypothetical protein